MTFKFYSSLQSGATLLSASVSDNADIYNTAVSIFRQVLVTGYGHQSGAGWTEPYPVGPGGEVFFKSPSTNVDWGIRFNGALSSVADYNNGQITVTLMKGATGIDSAEFMITLALTSRSTSVVRGRNWRFYVNPDRILFYVHTNTSGTGQTVPCFLGLMTPLNAWLRPQTLGSQPRRREESHIHSPCSHSRPPRHPKGLVELELGQNFFQRCYWPGHVRRPRGTAASPPPQTPDSSYSIHRW